MIFYFSGTGNSRWAARQLAARLDDTAVDLIGPDNLPDCSGEKRLGLVFPVYAWGLPEPVERFAARLPRTAAFTFGVATCGSEAGHALKLLDKIFPLGSSYSLVMPNNYIAGADLDDDATARAKLDAAEKALAVMAEEIAAARPVCRVHEGSLAGLKSSLVHYGFNRFARSTKPFYATDACTGCGQCARDCPASTIRLDNGRPVWGEHCYQCLRCLHRCPVQAIQYGKGTEDKGRYRIERYRQD